MDLPADVGDDRWPLADLINVACELHILPPDPGGAVEPLSREYRHFFLPRQESPARCPGREAQAYLARGQLDAVCDHLQAAAGTPGEP